MTTIERQLATVRKISDIIEIKNADTLCVYVVDGWRIVDKIDKFKKDELIIMIEVDSWVPHELAPFLSKGKEPREYEGVKGERLKTVKLRGEVGQGLILPLNTDILFRIESWVTFNIGLNNQLFEGMDVTEALNVKKWEPTLATCLRGLARSNFPAEIPKTDQERIQNLSKYWDKIKDNIWEVTEKLHGCFLRGQYIETFDGNTVTIGDIVNKGIRPDLIGVNEQGEIVPCQVTEVFNNGVKSKWLDIAFNHWNRTKVGGRGKLRATPNHKVFLKDMSEVDAGTLKQGDEILTIEIQYCENGIHYMRSSLLGDGHVGNNGHFSYNEGHATKYTEYLDYIEGIFENVKTSSRLATSGYGSEIKHIKVFTTSQLREMREDWYGTGKKALPKDISWIDDFSIAKWYMDDGSLSHSEGQNDRACFATNTFSKEDVLRLADKLKGLYNVDVTVFESKGWRIRVNWCKGSINKLWKAIARHIPQSMRYKLPEKFRNEPFEHYQKVKYVRKLIPVVVNSVTPVENTKRNFPNGRVGYDIETTTHNYFCGGVLVHNSSCSMILDTEDSFHVCSRNLDLKYDENNAYWKIAKMYNVESTMRSNNLNGYAIQGELIGEGLNGNQYGVKGLDFYVFDIYNSNSKKYLTPENRIKLTEALGLKHVPVISRCEKIQSETIKDLLSVVEKQKSNLNTSNIEGWVFKIHDGTDLGSRDVKSFKVISNAWLLKNE